MKIKNDYVLQKIADDYLVVPIGAENDRLHGVIKLNEAGAYLWGILEKGVKSKEMMKKALIDEYSIDEATAHKDVEKFVEQLNTIGCIED